MLDTAAARNLHADNGHALDVVAADDFGQLFGVVDAVKLWTTDQSYFTMDKVLMEAAVCVSGTVGAIKSLHRSKYGARIGANLI